MSFQVGLIAVRNISAASRNSRASTSHPANPRKNRQGSYECSAPNQRRDRRDYGLDRTDYDYHDGRELTTGRDYARDILDDLFHAVILRRAVVGNTWVAIRCQIGDRPSPTIYLRQLCQISRQDVLPVPSHVWTDYFRLGDNLERGEHRRTAAIALAEVPVIQLGE